MWTTSVKFTTVIMLWCCYNLGYRLAPIKANRIERGGDKGLSLEDADADTSVSEDNNESTMESSSSSSSSSSSQSSSSSSMWKSQTFPALPSSSLGSPIASKLIQSRHPDEESGLSGEENGGGERDSDGALINSPEKNGGGGGGGGGDGGGNGNGGVGGSSGGVGSTEWKRELFKEDRSVNVNRSESVKDREEDEKWNKSDNSALPVSFEQSGETRPTTDGFVPMMETGSSSSSSGGGGGSGSRQLVPSVATTEATESPSNTDLGSATTLLVSSRGEQEEKLLLKYLMRGYERDVRPVRNSSHPVVIEVGITLTQIFDMDEKNQVLTTNVWLDQEWYDELLRWDPSEFGGLESIRLPCERIWLPDIVLYNNADDYTQGYMPSRAMVSHDGKVFWPPPTKFRSTCPVDVTYFPFDDQICTMKLGSWTYNGFQVDVTNRTSEVDLSNYVSNGEWELLEAELQRNVVYYSCCPEPFPDVTITLIIRRKTLYYIYNVVLPCMMLSVLTLLVFCLPPDSGEKIALGITVLLAFSVFMLAIAEKMPETSESIPLIGIYLTAVMAITSVSVIVTVVVLNLHYLGPQVKSVPPWLRYFLPKEKRFSRNMSGIRQKSWLIPVTHREPRSGSLKRSHVLLPPVRHGSDSFMNTSNVVTLNTATSGNGSSTSLRGGGGGTSGCDHHLPTHEGMDVIKEPLSECSSTESVTNESLGNFSKSAKSSTVAINYHLHLPHQQNTTTSHHRHPNRQPHPKSLTSSHVNSGHSEVSREVLECSGGSMGGGEAAGAGNVQEELLRSIRHLIGKQEEVEAQNVLVAEWRLVAQAIDKILFWIFFLVTLVSSAVFLIILPLYKRSFNGPKAPGSNP